jgi:hypothetical protein
VHVTLFFGTIGSRGILKELFGLDAPDLPNGDMTTLCLFFAALKASKSPLPLPEVGF